jgi:hypothetical protein
MKQAFIIIQIGDDQLEQVCKEVIVPAIKACQLEPKRVDKHNEGGLLKNEIDQFISTSDIVIADLTNSRPNCYLEVGYTMGLDKSRNLILTAREDHNQDSSNFDPRKNKIHFDLGGYDILFWNPDELGEFKNELQKRIQRRLMTLPSFEAPKLKFDEEWISKHRGVALEGLQKTGMRGFMEIRMLAGARLDISQKELLRAAGEATIDTFGWPIGVVLTNPINPDWRPRPTSDGIICEIEDDTMGKHFDYWTLRRDGSFYLLKSLFEDIHKREQLFFNTRIVRITEVFLYASRLYNGLMISPDTQISIAMRHGGLKGRYIGSTMGREIFQHYESKEDESEAEITTTLAGLETNLVELVDKITEPLFAIFDFFKIEGSGLADIVNKYVAGKVT